MMFHYWQQQETTVPCYNMETITKQTQVKKNVKEKQNLKGIPRTYFEQEKYGEGLNL